jgi:hypothetical protein
MTPDDHGTESEPVDLTPLHSLRLGPTRRAALAGRIEAAAASRLDRRAARRRGIRPATLIETLADTAFPALLGAAAAVLLAIALHRGAGVSTEADADGVTAGVLALGSTERALAGGVGDATWILEQRAPTDADLARAIGLGTGEGGAQ